MTTSPTVHLHNRLNVYLDFMSRILLDCSKSLWIVSSIVRNKRSSAQRNCWCDVPLTQKEFKLPGCSERKEKDKKKMKEIKPEKSPTPNLSSPLVRGAWRMGQEQGGECEIWPTLPAAHYHLVLCLKETLHNKS